MLLIGNSLINSIRPEIFSRSCKIEKIQAFTISEAEEKLSHKSLESYEKVILQLITNDVKDKTVNETVKSLKNLVENISNKVEQVIISLAPPRSDDETWQAKTEQVNAEVTAAYINHQKIKISNNGNLGSRTIPIKRFYSDDVHLSRQGTSILVTNMKQALGLVEKNPREPTRIYRSSSRERNNYNQRQENRYYGKFKQDRQFRPTRENHKWRPTYEDYNPYSYRLK